MAISEKQLSDWEDWLNRGFRLDHAACRDAVAEIRRLRRELAESEQKAQKLRDREAKLRRMVELSRCLYGHEWWKTAEECSAKCKACEYDRLAAELKEPTK